METYEISSPASWNSKSLPLMAEKWNLHNAEYFSETLSSFPSLRFKNYQLVTCLIQMLSFPVHFRRTKVYNKQLKSYRLTSDSSIEADCCSPKQKSLLHVTPSFTALATKVSVTTRGIVSYDDSDQFTSCPKIIFIVSCHLGLCLPSGSTRSFWL
jgi:hypothetical protein